MHTVSSWGPKRSQNRLPDSVCTQFGAGGPRFFLLNSDRGKAQTNRDFPWGFGRFSNPKDVSRAILGSTCKGPEGHFGTMWKHVFTLGLHRGEFPSGFERFGSSKNVTGAILSPTWEGPGAHLGAVLEHF